MKNTKRTYSEAQINYMSAAAAFNAISKQEDITDDTYCAAYQAKIDAERALHAWCREMVATDPKTARQFGASASDMDNLFTNVWKFPTIREKLTDVCMRLAV